MRFTLRLILEVFMCFITYESTYVKNINKGIDESIKMLYIEHTPKGYTKKLYARKRCL